MNRFSRISRLPYRQDQLALDFYPDRSRLTVQLEAAIRGGQSHPITGGILLTLDMAPMADPNWFPGDQLLFRANLRPFRNFSNPGGFDYIRSQAEQGLFARAYLADERFMVKLRHGTVAFPGSGCRRQENAWNGSARAL